VLLHAISALHPRLPDWTRSSQSFVDFYNRKLSHHLIKHRLGARRCTNCLKSLRRGRCCTDSLEPFPVLLHAISALHHRLPDWSRSSQSFVDFYSRKLSHHLIKHRLGARRCTNSLKSSRCGRRCTDSLEPFPVLPHALPALHP